MSFYQLLTKLRDLDVKLWVEDDRLRLDAPVGALTPELKAELQERKEEILAFLQSSAASVEAADFTDFPLERVNRDQPLPLSFAQQRLWFLDRLAPGNTAYNIFTGLPFEGQLDLAALERSVNEIVRRHESLRTIFEMVDDEPVQQIKPFSPCALSIVDLTDLPVARRAERARQVAIEEAKRPFDLSTGPLFRATLLKLGEKSYEILFNMHHIISDGWSIGVLARELETLYGAFAAGKPSPLPELRIQYADYADWQRKCLMGGVLRDQIACWEEQLDGPLPVLELPTDHPRPANQTFEGAIHSFVLPQALVDNLGALSRREGVTLFMTLLATFDTLLYRYTGQEDLIVGTPIANRELLETEPLIGLFANTLVLRSNLAGDPSFREILSRVREVSLDAYANQDVPFEYLVEILRPERDPSRTPVFQVLFSYEKAEVPPLNIDNGAAKFDLSLFMWQVGDELTGLIEYNTALYSEATIRRLLGHYVTMLQAVVRDVDMPLSQLPLLTAEEQAQILGTWNDTKVSYPHEATIHGLFEARAVANGKQGLLETIAVISEEERLSYRQLNERANQLAHYLQELGVGVETPVGICLERSAEMLVGLLGILKAGGTYVPLDPAFPRQRLAYMLRDSGAAVVVTQHDLVDILPLNGGSYELNSNGASSELSSSGMRLVCLDQDWADIAELSTEAPVVEVSSADRAYVIYTSGSTGKPKGVQITHRSAVNFLLSMQREPGFRVQDVLMAVTTLSFDISVLELFLPLLSGGQVVVASREVASDGRLLGEALAASGATVMQATPATWRMMIEAGWQGQEGLKVLCGGEALPRELAAQLAARCAELWNMYGPTETTVWSTVEKIETEALQSGEPISIGRPIANTEVYVLDKQLQPVPVGVPGGLYIGGAGLAIGYLNRPELTAEKFIGHPFSNELDARLYDTGDVARYLADGRLEHLGRSDHQVKVRGFRIELGEIEAVLVGHEAVREAVVIAREAEGDDKRLVAYLIVADGMAQPATSELRDFVRQSLPEYMTPSAYVFLDSNPLTPNKKVDRKALPAPDMSALRQERAYVAPRNETEEVVAATMADVLKLPQVGVLDNFFELGGHSLLGTRLIARLESQLEVEISLRLLFEKPTVAGLSAAIMGNRGDVNRPGKDDIEDKLRLLESF